MLIDQFIEQYTQLERGRIERADPIQRFQKKLEVQRLSVTNADEIIDMGQSKSPKRARWSNRKN